jgi:hypothetical protein
MLRVGVLAGGGPGFDPVRGAGLPANRYLDAVFTTGVVR